MVAEKDKNAQEKKFFPEFFEEEPHENLTASQTYFTTTKPRCFMKYNQIKNRVLGNLEHGFRLTSWWTDSNSRPADYKSAALPTELHQQTFLSISYPVSIDHSQKIKFFNFPSAPAKIPSPVASPEQSDALHHQHQSAPHSGNSCRNTAPGSFPMI
jgi:hypothetical protein